MELGLDNKLEESSLSNNTISEFTKELTKALETKDIFVYQKPIDNGKFTDENLIKLDEEYQKDIFEFFNIPEVSEDKIYEVLKVGKSYGVVREYDSKTEKTKDLQASYNELPADCKEGMLLRKEGNKLAIDKELTQELYYKMKEYEAKLTNEQEKYLKKMRKNGELYYVKSVERRLQVMENRT